ncbi:MAG: helix-turn-helix domain-containing protein, partial [Candidatus Hermodarchaeota archaeon]
MSIPSEKIIIQAIAHDIRREILRILDSDPRTFTELLNHFDISSGKLTYHLNQIKGFVLKNEETAEYEVSSLGKKALDDLPEEFASRLDNVEVVVEDSPNRVHLQKSKIGHRYSLVGLYEGVPQTRR